MLDVHFQYVDCRLPQTNSGNKKIARKDVVNQCLEFAYWIITMYPFKVCLTERCTQFYNADILVVLGKIVVYNISIKHIFCKSTHHFVSVERGIEVLS